MKGDLKAVQVLSDIPKACVKVLEAESENATEPPAVADTPAVADYDPMNDLDDSPSALNTTRKLRVQKAQRMSQCRLLQVSMPMRPLCAGGTPADTIVIIAYRMVLTARNGAAKCYLRSDFFNWLLVYAADELQFQGVIPA